MLFVIDAGNTSVKVILYEGKGNIVFRDSVPTLRQKAEYYYRAFFTAIHYRYPEIDDYILSCVVPSITETLQELMLQIYGKKGMLVNAGLCKDLVIHLNDRNELGADLIASTYGALDKYEGPIIIADLGTATKITMINDKKEFMGGLILPGITISNKAIQLTIPHLPRIEPKLPEKLLNKDTVVSMQAGLMYGTLFQVEGIARALEEEQGVKATKLLTGGYAAELKEKMPEFHYEETLLEDGIYVIWEKYREKA